MTMKKVLVFAVLSVAMCAAAKPLTMMTYNVQIGAGLNDPYNFPKGSLGHLPQVAKHIREADPDWVAIQEIDRNVGRSGFVDQTQELAKMCGMKGRFFPKVMRLPRRFVDPSKAFGIYFIVYFILFVIIIRDVRGMRRKTLGLCPLAGISEKRGST